MSPDFKLWFSPKSQYWIVDQSNPWHYHRGLDLDEFMRDVIYGEMKLRMFGAWQNYFINLDKFVPQKHDYTKAIQIASGSRNKSNISIVSYGKLDGGEYIIQPVYMKTSELKDYIQKYIKLSFMM